MSLQDTLLTVGAATTAAAAITRAAQFFWRMNRRLVRTLAAVRQLVPEDGPTVRDTVDATAAQVGEIAVRLEQNTARLEDSAAKLSDVERRLNGHLESRGQR